jgi:electron transport complex protein RnfC
MAKKIKTYPITGGIRPPFVNTSDIAIETLPLPTRVVLPLVDTFGRKATPTVRSGDRVLTGQLIAEPVGKTGNPVCASLSGTISIQPFMHPLFGCPVESAVITSDSLDRAAPPQKTRGDYYRYPASELITAIRNAAITGHRGAALHDQLTEGCRHEASVLIVDATDAEPGVFSETRLLLERPKDVTEGIRVLLYILDAFKCVITVTGETKKNAAALKTILFDEPNIFLATLARIYPAGLPHQLNKAVTGAKSIPARGGAVIVTPSAAIAVTDAVKEGRPAITRTVSVGGKGVSALKTVQVRNGTLLSEIMAFAGGKDDDLSMPVAGGPLSGKTLPSLEVPILPETTAITFLSKDELSTTQTKQCVRCGACVRVCPESMNPALLSVSSQHHDWKEFARHRPAACSECGCCAYVCPAHRPIVRHIREGKNLSQRETK